MGRVNKETIKIYKELDEHGFSIINGDAIEKINLLKNNSIKLMYGSPPYPNAKRNYETWENDNYINEINPFIKNVIPKLTDDGFIVINVKANRLRATKQKSSERSLIVEKLMIHMKEKLQLYCVDIEIWIKSNPVPTGVRVKLVKMLMNITYGFKISSVGDWYWRYKNRICTVFLRNI